MPRCMTVLFRNEANNRLPLNNKHPIKSSEETFRHTNSLWTRHSVPVYLGIYYQLHGDSRRETQANCKQIVIVIWFYLFLISETIEFSFVFFFRLLYFKSFIFNVPPSKQLKRIQERKSSRSHKFYFFLLSCKVVNIFMCNPNYLDKSTDKMAITDLRSLISYNRMRFIV